MDTKARIQRIQRHLGLDDDGLIAPNTLTAIERALFATPTAKSAAKAPKSKAPASNDPPPLMTVSKSGLEKLVAHEVSSPAYYARFLSKPVFPGGMSGCTIGIGYDLGYNSAAQIARDWRGILSDADLACLQASAGLKGDAAAQRVKTMGDVKVPLAAAEQVFYQATLPRYARLCQKTYPGVEALPADAQAALLSLIYNRGGSVSGSRRREMKAIQPLVSQGDLDGIADEILAMRRLWEGKGLDGLLRRREDEAALVRKSQRQYQVDELINV